MTVIEFHSQMLHFESSLKKFAYRLTLEKDDAKDLLQETYLKVLVNKDKYLPDTNLKAWMFIIMKNTFINNYKRNIRQNTFFDRTTESFFINQSQSSEIGNPDSIYSTMEMNDHIDNLKEQFRVPFKMHVSGYKYQEIADHLHLNLGTIKSRIFFSRKQLMQNLGE